MYFLEPVTPVTDSWAQGSVPIMLRPSSASSASSVQSDRESELSSVVEERPWYGFLDCLNVKCKNTCITKKEKTKG